MSLFSLLKKYKSNKPPTCTVVIAAAGLSKRCEGEDKLFFEVCGKPVLAHTIDVFQKCALVNDIIIVSQEEKFESIGALCKKYGFSKVSKAMKGGETRLESVINGVYAASSKAKLIAIHDGARPCIDLNIIEETIRKAADYLAAAPAVPITSTVKNVEDSVILNTVEREGLYEVQTPQIFRAEIIKAALTNAIKKSIAVTDDCLAAEIIGVPVHIVEGSRKNIKITERADLQIAEAFLKKEIF